MADCRPRLWQHLARTRILSPVAVALVLTGAARAGVVTRSYAQQDQGGRQLPLLRQSGLLTVRSLRVAAQPNEGSRIFLGPAGSAFSIGTEANGDTFTIREDSSPAPLLELGLQADAKQDVLRLPSRHVEVASLSLPQGLVIRSVNQWQLVQTEDFKDRAPDWSRPEVTSCSGVTMLGGYCRFSNGETNKTFSGLPPHGQLRVKATYHFIDNWIGEAGYMKLNIGEAGSAPVVVWTEQHAQSISKHGLNLCGRGATPEGKFAVPIDVTVEHSQDSVQIAFGSTMEDADPCDESWGISSIELYTREGTAVHASQDLAGSHPS